MQNKARLACESGLFQLMRHSSNCTFRKVVLKATNLSVGLLHFAKVTLLHGLLFPFEVSAVPLELLLEVSDVFRHLAVLQFRAEFANALLQLPGLGLGVLGVGATCLFERLLLPLRIEALFVQLMLDFR